MSIVCLEIGLYWTYLDSSDLPWSDMRGTIWSRGGQWIAKTLELKDSFVRSSCNWAPVKLGHVLAHFITHGKLFRCSMDSVQRFSAKHCNFWRFVIDVPRATLFSVGTIVREKKYDRWKTFLLKYFLRIQV